MGLASVAQAATIAAASFATSIAPTAKEGVPEAALATSSAVTTTYTPTDVQADLNATTQPQATTAPANTAPIAVPENLRQVLAHPAGQVAPIMGPRELGPTYNSSAAPHSTENARAQVEKIVQENSAPSTPMRDVPRSPLQAEHAAKEMEEKSNLVYNDFVRSKGHLSPQSLQAINVLKARPAADQAIFSINTVESALWMLGNTGKPLPGLTVEETAGLRAMQAEFKMSGPELAGKSKAEIEAMKSAYPAACKEYVYGKLYNVQETTMKKALEGFDSPSAARSLYRAIHAVSLTDEQKRTEMVSIVANAGTEKLPRLANDYAAVPLRDAGQALRAAFASKDLDAAADILRPCTAFEAGRLIGYADEDAKARNLPTIEEMATQLTDKKDLQAYQKMTVGYKADSQAHDALIAYKSSEAWNIGQYAGGLSAMALNFFSKQPAEAQAIKDAFGYTKGIDGKEGSIFSAEQIADIRSEIRAKAVQMGKDPNEAEAFCVEVAKVAVENPRQPLVPGNLYADLKAGAIDGDFTILTTTAGSYYDSTLAARMLHTAIEKGDGATVIAVLEKGADDKRSTYLEIGTKHQGYDDFSRLLAAYNQQFDNPETSRRQPLVAGIQSHLSPEDARVATQIIEQRFYPAERAAAVAADPSQAHSIIDPTRSLAANVTRVELTDSALQKATGKGLVETINASSLSETQKNTELSVAYLPAMTALHSEFSKDAPDSKVIAGYLAIPRAEEFYNQMFRAENANVRGTLERLGREKKLDIDFVVGQELALSGLPLDAEKKLEAELDPANPKIGTKESILRSFSPTQLRDLESCYNTAEMLRASARGDHFVDFREAILKLNENGSISSARMLRASMSMSGVDPWNTAAEIDANRVAASTILTEKTKARIVSALMALNPNENEQQMKNVADGLLTVAIPQIRDVFREEKRDKGEKPDSLLGTWMGDRSVRAYYKNDTDYGQAVEKLTDTLYGSDVDTQVIAVDAAISGLKRSDLTPEQKQQLLGQLQSAFEKAAAKGELGNVHEVYDIFFAKPGEEALIPDIDQLAASGVLDSTQQLYLKNLLAGKPN